MVVALMTLVLFDPASHAEETAVPAQAASPPAPPTASSPSLVELKAAAYDADEASRRAEAAAAEAQVAAEAARAAVDRASGVAPVPATGAATDAAVAVEAVDPPPATPDARDEALHRATEAAENAAAAARAATAALQQQTREHEQRFSRNGVVVLGGVFWAPELFTTAYAVSDSKGANIAIGYHFARHFEVDVRYEQVDDFDLVYGNVAGTFDAWSTTLNGRFYMLTKQFQPYLGMGIGVMQGTTFLQNTLTGYAIQEQDVVAVFRVSGGFDFYISETLALTADASVDIPGGGLTNATYATLGGGLKLRF